MSFIEIEPGNYGLYAFLLSFAGVALVVTIVLGIIVSAKQDFSKGPNIAMGVSLVVTIGFAIGALSTLSTFSEPKRDQLKEVRSSIQERYNIDLSKAELKDLDYPDSEPKKDFKAFGTVTRDVELKGGFERQEISLIWRNDRFELAQSNDGQDFTTLKPQGDNDSGSAGDEPFFAPSSAATEEASNG